MKGKNPFMLILSFLVAFNCVYIGAQETEPITDKVLKPQDKLVVLWTSGDREVALKMAFMYTYNAKKYGWWKDITLVVWGPSSKLLSTDKELQDYMKKIMDTGTTVLACKGCSDLYGVSKQLEDLGITVKYIGVELTTYLKEGWRMLTL
jgi:hypothetical protein